MGKKVLNSSKSKKAIVEAIEGGTKQLEQARWLTTQEGQEYLIRIQQEKLREEIRKKLKIGQLVWQRSNGWMKPIEDGHLVQSLDLCSKIIAIETDKIAIEFLYALNGNEKGEEYYNFLDDKIEKGRRAFVDILDLKERHNKMTGNIWWKLELFSRY